MPQVEFLLLGPLEARVGGREITFTAKRRALLAALALEAGRVVSGDRLIEELWGDAVPAAAASRVRTLVADVRKAFGTAGVILTRHPGYLLDLEHTELDVDVFSGLKQQAALRHCEGREDEAIEPLDRASGLWRGDPLTDLYGPRAVSEVQRLLEERRSAIETRAELKLAQGRHAEVIAEHVTSRCTRRLRW
ncbi:AfsR/SARP family transcriptional regulator [Nonomuraea deserti]|uniref:AfsR/SARP family transcriptional regulator n=1 Tax=Nonomuraea deserti TaxID=1848322 RepID=UPI0014054AAB|nr:BTAD domain-containing putative transcriptional regulator [Nonomuraea deserti]